MAGKRGSTGTINLSQINGEPVADLDGKVHRLPCSIKHDGPADVSHYFKPKSTGTEIDGLKVEEAHFRGRELQGATISLPNGYSGFVLGQKSKVKREVAAMNDEYTCWETKAKFDKLTYWNHQTLPSKDDLFLRTFHWLAVAEAMHKPVTAEDLVAAGKNH